MLTKLMCSAARKNLNGSAVQKITPNKCTNATLLLSQTYLLGDNGFHSSSSSIPPPPPKLLKFLNPTSAIQSDSLIHHRFSLKKHLLIIKCTPTPTPTPTPPEPDDDFPNPQPVLPQPETNLTDPQPMYSQPETKEDQRDRLAIEKRSKFGMFLKKPKASLVKPEPKNFEIGWKRTVVINLEKPKGYVIADFLLKLENLMDKGAFGSRELLAKTGEIVAEKAREEAEVLREEGEVDERLITELNRVLRLMEMDLAMIKASVKEETLKKRVEQAKVRCRQAILVANSF